MEDSDPSKTAKEHSQNFNAISIKKNVVLNVKKMVCCLHCRSYFQDIQALSNHVQIRVQCRIKENFDILENHQNFLNPSSAGLNYPSKLTPSHPPLSAVFSTPPRSTPLPNHHLKSSDATTVIKTENPRVKSEWNHDESNLPYQNISENLPADPLAI